MLFMACQLFDGFVLLARHGDQVGWKTRSRIVTSGPLRPTRTSTRLLIFFPASLLILAFSQFALLIKP